MTFPATIVSLLLAAPPVNIEATYPGAGPEVIEATVAVPLELALGGIKGVRRVTSLSTEGHTRLQLHLDDKADPLIVRQAVAERLASAKLPDACKPVILPSTDDTFDLLILCSTKHDALALHNLASEVLRPRVEKSPHVVSALVLGGGRPRLNVFVDPTKLAAHALTAADLDAVLKKAAETPLKQTDDLTSTIIAAKDGKVVRLKDVVQVEQSREADSDAGVAFLDAKKATDERAVILLIRYHPGKSGGSFDELKKHLPGGVSLDRHTARDREWMASLRVPSGTSMERKGELARRAARAALGVEGVQRVTWLATEASDEVRLLFSPAIDDGKSPTLAGIRKRLAPFADAEITLTTRRPLIDPLPGEGMDVALKVRGDDPGLEELRKTADDLTAKLAKNPSLVDVLGETSSRASRLQVDIDHVNASILGVEMRDVMNTLSTYTGGKEITSVRMGGRVMPVVFRLGKHPFRPDDLRALKVRTSEGKMVSLGALAAFRFTEGASAIYREQGKRCVVVSCNAADRTRLDEVVKALRKLADEESGKSVKIVVER